MVWIKLPPLLINELIGQPAGWAQRPKEVIIKALESAMVSAYRKAVNASGPSTSKPK